MCEGFLLKFSLPCRKEHPETSERTLTQRGMDLWNSFAKVKKDTYQKLAEVEQAQWWVAVADKVEDRENRKAEQARQAAIEAHKECDAQGRDSEAKSMRAELRGAGRGAERPAEQASGVHQGAVGSAQQAATSRGEAADNREAALRLNKGRQQDGHDSARAANAGAGSSAVGNPVGLGASLRRENGKADKVQAPSAGPSSLRQPESLEQHFSRWLTDQMGPAKEEFEDRVARELASKAAEQAGVQAQRPSADVRPSAAEVVNQPHLSAQNGKAATGEQPGIPAAREVVKVFGVLRFSACDAQLWQCLTYVSAMLNAINPVYFGYKAFGRLVSWLSDFC